MRLLTDEEIREIVASFMPGLEEHLKHIKLDAHIQIAEAEHKATPKAVGEWLENKMEAVPQFAVVWHIRLDDVEALKRGEMPEEEK